MATFIESRACNEVYDLDSTDEEFRYELEDPSWQCPNLTEFSLSNDAWRTKGTNLNYVVNYCSIAHVNSTECVSLLDSIAYSKDKGVE